MAESESIDERFILDNWNLLSNETRLMLKVIGISPNIQNGKKTNQFWDKQRNLWNYKRRS